MKVERKFLKETYGLKEEVREAFSDKTARKKQLEWWINREEEVEEWRKIIRKSTSLNKNYIVFIIGSYGRGKTLSLLKVIDEAEKYKEICLSYLNFKGEEKSKSGLDFIFRIFRSIDFHRLKSQNTDNKLQKAVENIPEAFHEAKKVLSKICFDEIDRYQQKLFAGKKQAHARSRSERSNLALFFLRGEVRPTASQLKQLGIIRKIESIDTAKEYLGAVLCFLKSLGYETLLLAIDEFEYLFSLVPKSQHSIYIALLRGLYDFPTGFSFEPNNIASMVFFIAISEDGWNSLKEMEKGETSIGGPTVPLLDRVDATTTLGVFDRKQTRELIIKRLRYNRIKGRFENQPLIPFTEDFVEHIYKQTNGEPRAIIVRCGQVLDAGLAERIGSLDKDFAQRVLDERGF
jgi:hypothetical protein